MRRDLHPRPPRRKLAGQALERWTIDDHLAGGMTEDIARRRAEARLTRTLRKVAHQNDVCTGRNSLVDDRPTGLPGVRDAGLQVHAEARSDPPRPIDLLRRNALGLRQ